MSDEINETDEQSELDAIRKQLLKYIITAGIGWAALWLTLWNFKLFLVGMPLFLLITPWFCWKTMFANGIMGAFMGASLNYEVITTYRDGSQKSDGGQEAFEGNMLLLCLKIPLFVFTAVFVKLWYILYGCFVYYTTYREVKQKPSFAKSAFPVMIAGLIMFIGFAGAGKIIDRVYQDMRDAKITAAGNPRIELNKETYSPGETIIVKYVVGHERSSPRIGLYDDEDRGPFNDDAIYDIKGNTGEFKVIAPKSSGAYEIRFTKGLGINEVIVDKKPFKVQ